jgi:hypothetical protein
MIDEIGDERRKSPIIGAVLEQITNRHCSIAESVDELRLEQTLSIMNRMANQSKSDGLMNWTTGS